jgi:hypothetical protein
VLAAGFKYFYANRISSLIESDNENREPPGLR